MNFDFDKELKKKIAQANQSIIGRFFSFLAAKIGGISVSAGLHLLFVLVGGILMTFPLFIAGGFWLALPTGAFTIILIALVLISIFSYWSKSSFARASVRKLLVFAMLFSLPFSLLSLPLLNAISQEKK
ncbi:hypothetical protein KKE06_03455 [Candidatus Micrarchaeota archaeon]|nr:hypothetical protein [Candidatus Micrarchaeota archaeon]MBU1931059.1 hypothetical protein [Candidatus Micrarchaeota archaeon]